MSSNLKSDFFKSLKFKLSLPVIISSVVLSVGILVLTYSKFTSDLDENVKLNFEIFEKMFSDQINAKKEDAIMAMEVLINNELLVSKFANGEREELSDMLLSLYNDKLKKDHDVVQLQFHTPPATSFLRLHKPSQFGDDLSSFRETVNSANSIKKIVSGIEVGRGGAGLRVVSPVNYEGNHVGTVEFGIDIGKILTGINNALNIEYAVGITKAAFEKARRFNSKDSDIVNGDVVFYEYSDERFKENIASQKLKKDVERISKDDKDFATYSFQIKDYANNEVGSIILFSDITAQVSSMKASIFQTVLLILVFTSLASLVMILGLRKSVLNPINFLSKAANDFSSGEKNVDFSLNSDNELGVLSTNLKEMAEKIKLQLQYLDNLPTPVTIIDKDFTVQYINNAAATFSGIEQKTAIGQKCSNLFETPHCGTDNCGCLKAMELDKSITSETVSASNSQNRSILYTGSPIKNDKGEIIGALESAAEITNIKEQEEYLSRSTQKMLEAMTRFSQGDLTVNVVPENINDEIGSLFAGFNSAVKNIKNLVVNLSDAIAATASASTQISSSSEELAAGSQEQSAQTGEVASAIEEMTVTIVESTKNVTIAADSAKEAGLTASNGGKVIKKTIQGIESISDVVSEAASAVEMLGNSSEKIGEIIEVIDEIAGQTNLLALNAAIEAARAGEHGRGFAVVADEVSKLADRTINATKQIAETIENIQLETSKAVGSIRKGRDEAIKGKEFASEASQSLEMIISKTDSVIEQIDQVATASEEQAATAEQVSKNIEIINSVSQESARGVQQIAGAAEDLNKLTEQLQELVNMFKVVKEQNQDEKYTYKTQQLVNS
jgi:PAS domain S-box-containing protein